MPSSAPLKIAVIGLRHPHINDLLARVQAHNDFELVALCEDDNDTKQQLPEKFPSVALFEDYEQMLDSIECDVVGIGDYFARRGRIAIAALERGKHVISDKPLCTSLDELDEIERLANEKNLSVGCMLDLRDSAVFSTVQELVRGGEIGQVHSVSFGGQHALNYGTRASWYFEPEKHGGTINDIGIHAIDFVSVLTRQPIKKIDAARNWNAQLPQIPWFKDAAQIMLTLEDGCGVLGDFSYLLPNGIQENNPFYWRVTIWGAEGVMEVNWTATAITVFRKGEAAPRTLPLGEGNPGGYLKAFLNEIENGKPTTITEELSTVRVIDSQRIALQVQSASDN